MRRNSKKKKKKTKNNSLALQYHQVDVLTD